MTNGVDGPLEDLLRTPLLLDLPAIHDHDTSRELERLFLIVRDEEARQVNLLVEAAKPAPQLLTDLCVERAERFVEQQHARLHGEGPREGDALPLTARELRRISGAKVIELHELEEILDLPGNFRVRRAPVPRSHSEAERDVLEHRHVSEERVVLKDEPDCPISRAGVGRVLALEQHRARIGSLQAGDDAQQRRLAAARGPEERDELSRGDGEAHVLHGREAAVRLGYVADVDRHSSNSSRAVSTKLCTTRRSTMVFKTSVTSASEASSDDTANAA